MGITPHCAVMVCIMDSHWRAPLSNGWDPLTKTYWGDKPTHPLYKAWRENMDRAQEEADRRKSAWLEHMKAPKFTLVVYEHDLVNDKYEKTVAYHNIYISSKLFEEIRKKVPLEKWARLVYFDGEKEYPFLKDPSYKAYFEHHESEFETHVKDKMKTLKTPPLFRLKLEKKSHCRAAVEWLGPSNQDILG